LADVQTNRTGAQLSLLEKFRIWEHTRKNLDYSVREFYYHNLKIRLFRKFKLKMQQKKYGLVSTNLETYGHCNRKCSFCFNNDRFQQREKGELPAKYWKKIIDDLAKIDFAGRISPHFYGEPLLDKRLPDLLAYARKRLPLAHIVVVSNGDFLDEKQFRKFIKIGVDHFAITNYDDFERPILEDLQNKFPLHIHVRSYQDYEKTDRTGEIFLKHKEIHEPCLRPASQLVINWQGEVLLCCMDYYAKEVMGNLKQTGLWQIWNSPKFQEYRRILGQGQRQKIGICQHCDDPGEIPW
jgi:8-amino-3,8-dideoxy-alpha-D-manno-octulosonate transaminase